MIILGYDILLQANNLLQQTPSQRILRPWEDPERMTVISVCSEKDFLAAIDKYTVERRKR